MIIMKKILFLIGMISLLILCSCKIVPIEKKGDASIMPVETNSELDFMIEKYGFTADELEGVDLIKFINEYQLKTRDFTADEVRELLVTRGKYYIDDGKSKLYQIFDNQPGGSLSKDAKITKVAFVYNEGTLEQHLIFDLTNDKWYLDDATPHDMSKDQKELIEGLASKCDIYNWKNNYKGTEADSTGSLYWKLVLELEDGSYCVYSGYTQDGSHLPPNYGEFYQILKSIVTNNLN